MAKLNEKTNLDNQFFRNTAIAFMAQWRNQICFKHTFSDEEKEVTVPVFYSKTGDPRFLFEAVYDEYDLCSVELDVAPVPSIVIYQSGLVIKSDEQTNPNVQVSFIEEEGDSEELVRYFSSLKAIPIDVQYTVDFYTDSENQLWKFQQAYLEEFYKYRFFTYDYNRLKIEAFFEIPDDLQFEIKREFEFAQEQRTNKVTLNLNVTTYYPAFNKKRKDIRYWASDKDSLFGRNTLYAPWEQSNQVVASERVMNWLLAIIDEKNPEFNYSAVPPFDNQEKFEEKLDIVIEELNRTVNGRTRIPGSEEFIDISDISDDIEDSSDFLLDV